MRGVTPGSGERSTAAWREARLLEAGFLAGRARCLARDGRYDVHALIELTERGCPPDLAERIVAPLDAPDTDPC